MEDALAQPLVPESELIKRLIEIARLYYPSDIEEKGIDILLHGEPLEAARKLIECEEMPADIREASVKAVNRMLDKRDLWGGGMMPSEARPTRTEWAEKMPRQMLFEEWHQWADAFCEWFLTMPGIPKE